MPRSETLTNFLRLAEDYAQAANSPRRAGAFAALEKAATELVEDRERIDWLDDNMSYVGGGNGGTYSFTTPLDAECGMLRAAIDAKRKLVDAVQFKRGARGLADA